MLTGWALLFHPDLLHGTPLDKKIKHYSFFDYRVNEALHMTDEEHDIFVSLIQQIRNELQNKHDEFQKCDYSRIYRTGLEFLSAFFITVQFATRTLENSDILMKVR